MGRAFAIGQKYGVACSQPPKLSSNARSLVSANLFICLGYRVIVSLARAGFCAAFCCHIFRPPQILVCDYAN